MVWLNDHHRNGTFIPVQPSWKFAEQNTAITAVSENNLLPMPATHLENGSKFEIHHPVPPLGSHVLIHGHGDGGQVAELMWIKSKHMQCRMRCKLLAVVSQV